MPESSLGSSSSGPWIADKLRRARDDAGLSQAELARALGMTQTAVSYWESARRLPGLDDLIAVAEILNRDVTEFLPPRNGEAVPVLLRAAVHQLGNPALTKSIETFLQHGDVLAVPRASISLHEDSPIRAAQKLLSKGGITDPPVNVESLASDCGAAVVLWDFEDALSGLVAHLANGPVIGVNQTHTRERRRFTIAHELGHLLLRHSDRYYLDLQANAEEGDPPGYHPINEREANEFAANLLMPAAIVRAVHSKTPGISTLARVFKVSELAMRYRVANLDLARTS